MTTETFITGDELSKRPVDEQVNYTFIAARGWKFRPMPKVINSFLYGQLSLEMQAKFRYDPAAVRYERIA